jgi:thiamine-phosphate pyrophosphorylase
VTPLDLRLIVITDRQLAAPRSIEWIVQEALAAGAPAIQLRDKTARASELLVQAQRLRDLTARYHARLFINDRLDVALASHADGVHLGPDDIPMAAARRSAPSLLLGYSTDSPDEAQQAERVGASYIGCGSVFPTTSKAEVAGEAIGAERLRDVVRAVRLPVIAIGGIAPDNIESLAGTGIAGCAVIGAIMTAANPGSVVETLLRVQERAARTTIGP